MLCKTRDVFIFVYFPTTLFFLNPQPNLLINLFILISGGKYGNWKLRTVPGKALMFEVTPKMCEPFVSFYVKMFPLLVS